MNKRKLISGILYVFPIILFLYNKATKDLENDKT